MHVEFSCVSGERVSDVFLQWHLGLQSRIWLVSWNYLFSWWLQMQRERRSHLPCYPGTNMYIHEERTSDSCQSPWALSPPHKGLICSPARAMAGHGVGEILLELKDAALTGPPTYWSFQCLGLRSFLSTTVFLTTPKSPSYNSVFFLSILSFQFPAVFHA